MGLMMTVARNRVTSDLQTINEAAAGKHCQCVCCLCGAELIAKQGEELAWHFAHMAGETCRADTSGGESSGVEYKAMGQLHAITQDLLGYSEAQYSDQTFYRDDARWQAGGRKALFEIVSTSPMTDQKLYYIAYRLWERGVSVWVVNLRSVRHALLNLLERSHDSSEAFRRVWLDTIAGATRRMATARDGRLRLLQKIRESGDKAAQRGWWVDRNWSPTAQYTKQQYSDLAAYKAACLAFRGGR